MKWLKASLVGVALLDKCNPGFDIGFRNGFRLQYQARPRRGLHTPWGSSRREARPGGSGTRKETYLLDPLSLNLHISSFISFYWIFILECILNLIFSPFHLLHQTQGQHKPWKWKIRGVRSPHDSRKKTTKLPSEETTTGIALGDTEWPSNFLSSHCILDDGKQCSSSLGCLAGPLLRVHPFLLNSWCPCRLCLHSPRGNLMVPCICSLQHERTTKNTASMLSSQGSITI